MVFTQHNKKTFEQYKAGIPEELWEYNSNSKLNPNTEAGKQAKPVADAVKKTGSVTTAVAGTIGSTVGGDIGSIASTYADSRSNEDSWVKTATGVGLSAAGYGPLVSANNWVKSNVTNNISSQYGRNALQYGPLPWVNPFYWAFGDA